MDSIPAFLKHKAPEIEPAWSNVALSNAITKNASARDERTQSTASTSLVAITVCKKTSLTFPRIRNRTAHFKDFIHACTHRFDDNEIRRFNINGGYTWEDVKAEADKAVDAYNKKASSWRRNPFRSAGRAIGDKGAVTQTWLELLPAGEYTSIVCGAMKLVFGVYLSPSRL